MSQFQSKQDECFILVKAQPHRSSQYFETVCCAGIGRDGKWRRQYPVPFRILSDSQKFQRWSWIKYDYTTSSKDLRIESQKVIPESLIVGDKVKPSERSKLLNSLIRGSFTEADERGESLTMLRPKAIELSGHRKSATELKEERERHAELANQLSLFDKTAKPLEPCPVQFKLKWTDQEGVKRDHECDDWETSAAYQRFYREYGHDEALRVLKNKYEKDYFSAGLVLAFSTHSRRNVTFGSVNQWLLVGMIRLDENSQGDLLWG